MPTRIPVQISDTSFPSINKARMFYTDILHRCDPQRDVDHHDQVAVLELMDSANMLPSRDHEATRVRVVRGKFGRRCFAAQSAESGSRMMSIVRAVKACAI